MNRFVFGRGWVVCNEANGDGGDGGGGAAGAPGAAAGDGGGEGGAPPAGGEGGGGGDGAAAAPDGKKEEAPKDMKSAIDAALGYKKGPNGEALDPLTGKPKDAPAGEKKGEKLPAGEGKDTETHHANGKPKKNDKGEDLDAEGKVVQKQAAKPKSAAELDLKPEELKALGPKTQQRFREVIGTLKAHEGTIATLNATNKTLAAARDEIIGVLEETNTTQDELAGYLEFNAMLKSGQPAQFEEALKIVERQRAALYKALGREPQGGDIDLLAEFPDLKKQVDEEEITRAAALEIASGRREKAARTAAEQRQQNQQRSQQQTAEQRQQAAETALGEIEKWTSGLAKSDLDYKAKEDKLLAKLDGVLKSYPPNQWLPTLKLLYEGIEIQKAPAAGGKQNQPLRPSGATPGAKAPSNMLEAINQGLGYGAGKG